MLALCQFFPNIFSLLILLISVDISLPVMVFLWVYFFLGFLVWYKEWNTLYFIFGCKTYGSLNLVIILNSIGYLGWASYIGGLIHPVLATELGAVLIGWVIISFIVIISGEILEHCGFLPELH